MKKNRFLGAAFILWVAAVLAVGFLPGAMARYSTGVITFPAGPAVGNVVSVAKWKPNASVENWPGGTTVYLIQGSGNNVTLPNVISFKVDNSKNDVAAVYRYGFIRGFSNSFYFPSVAAPSDYMLAITAGDYGNNDADNPKYPEGAPPPTLPYSEFASPLVVPHSEAPRLPASSGWNSPFQITFKANYLHRVANGEAQSSYASLPGFCEEIDIGYIAQQYD